MLARSGVCKHKTEHELIIKMWENIPHIFTIYMGHDMSLCL